MEFPEYNSYGCSAYRSEVTCTAEIVNQTQQVLDMKVSNSVYFVHLAHLGRGATHTVPVDYTDTYQEYKFSPLGSSADSTLVVTSDECCDFKRITIMEVDGRLAVRREPRVCAGESALQENAAPAPPPQVLNRECSGDVGVSSWKWWIRLRIF